MKMVGAPAAWMLRVSSSPPHSASGDCVCVSGHVWVPLVIQKKNYPNRSLIWSLAKSRDIMRYPFGWQSRNDMQGAVYRRSSKEKAERNSLHSSPLGGNAQTSGYTVPLSSPAPLHVLPSGQAHSSQPSAGHFSSFSSNQVNTTC